MVVINKHQYPIVKQLYTDIHNQYVGQHKELLQQVEKTELRHQNEMKIMELKLRECEIRERDNQIMYLKKICDLNNINH